MRESYHNRPISLHHYPSYPGFCARKARQADRMPQSNSSMSPSSISSAPESTPKQDQLIGKSCLHTVPRSPTDEYEQATAVAMACAIPLSKSSRTGEVRKPSSALQRLPNQLTVFLGGRTAWSCMVNVGGREIHARFWYDSPYVGSAREDAAERALQVLGQIPTPAGPQPAHFQQQQRAVYRNGFGAVHG